MEKYMAKEKHRAYNIQMHLFYNRFNLNPTDQF